MGISLEDFVTEQQIQIVEFQKWWIEQHHQAPLVFPMSMEEGNEGLWWEMFQNFQQDGR